MGVASLVLGILALIVAWVPCVGVYALLFSVIGLILGAIGMVKAKKTGEGKGLSIAGFVCNVVATAIAIYWCVIIGGAAVAANDISNDIKKSKSEISKSWNELKSDLKSSASELSGALEKLKDN